MVSNFSFRRPPEGQRGGRRRAVSFDAPGSPASRGLRLKVLLWGLALAALAACNLDPPADPPAGFEEHSELFVADPDDPQGKTWIFQTNDPAYWSSAGYTLWARNGTDHAAGLSWDRSFTLTKESGDEAAGYGVLFGYDEDPVHGLNGFFCVGSRCPDSPRCRVPRDLAVYGSYRGGARAVQANVSLRPHRRGADLVGAGRRRKLHSVASVGRSWKRLNTPTEFERLSHYLFKYPAKFHPPVVHTLLERYTQQGQVVLDPFCGSGTLLVEARVAGRNSVGLDIDPVAVAVARAKVHRYQPHRLRKSADVLLDRIAPFRRSDKEYASRMFEDLGADEYERAIEPLSPYLPDMGNILHWFRRYVIVDLATIRTAYGP